MNKQLLKIAGFATLVLFLHNPGFAQVSGSLDRDDNDTTPGRSHSLDEIIIRHKGNKDAKVSIEIKNGEVFINGKPASEYKDEDLTITKRKFKTLGDNGFAFPDDNGAMAITPFRNYGGVWNYGPKPAPGKVTSHGAFLGVSSKKQDNGPEGAKVTNVSEGSAAEKAGLKEGDLITKMDDKTIDGPEALVKAVHSYKPGDKVSITFLRNGKEQKVTAELGKSKASTYNLYGYGDHDWNFDMPDMDLRKLMPPGAFNFSYDGHPLRLGIHAQDTEDGKGVKVLDVDEESAAAKAGIKEGDIITRFDGQEVNSATRLAELARISREDNSKTTVKLSLLRGGKPLEVEVKTPRKLRTADL